MKSFTIVALSFILFNVFLLTSCYEEIVINILNSVLMSERWTFNHAYKWYDAEIDTSFETEDLLITDSNSENIVTEENVFNKLKMGLQLLTFEYAKIVHWISSTLSFMNKKLYGDGEIYSETKERLKTFKLTYKEVNRVLILFHSALVFMKSIRPRQFIAETCGLIDSLSEFNLNSNKSKVARALEGVDLDFTFNTFKELIKELVSSEYILLSCCEIKNIFEGAFDEKETFELINYKLNKQHHEKLMEKPDEKSKDEFTYFVFLHETILNSVDEIIKIYYTNLGFNYDEKKNKSNYILP
ncbi:uncharacterized protein LOC126907541 [Daktulosphaira vitifoliae]|uniref:uncharacterized protein LOC126907541 n=1 Tax=Daktulosphaira vitifoliae TaxID=58002 RepID=UPI0021AA6E11|nr:uncharacterized protein LOC126907541 [Daktulosphaira vitifoliae]